MRTFESFIGVDLGGGRGKKTAVARLKRTPDGVSAVFVGTRNPAGEPFYDHQLLAYLRQYGAEALVAVDAPLRPSVCVRCRLDRCEGLSACQDPVVRWFRTRGDALVRSSGRRRMKPTTTAYTQRACEVVLSRGYGVMPRETLGQGMGPLTARAHYLRRALGREFEIDHNLIEVYPKVTIHSLFGPGAAAQYKREVRTWKVRAMILEALPELRFDVWREGSLKNDHCFDAVICAYTAYRWAAEGWTLPAQDREIFEQDGWIWFPPMEGIET